jgi:hypothetical protein
MLNGAVAYRLFDLNSVKMQKDYALTLDRFCCQQQQLFVVITQESYYNRPIRVTVGRAITVPHWAQIWSKSVRYERRQSHHINTLAVKKLRFLLCSSTHEPPVRHVTDDVASSDETPESLTGAGKRHESTSSIGDDWHVAHLVKIRAIGLNMNDDGSQSKMLSN